MEIHWSKCVRTLFIETAGECHHSADTHLLWFFIATDAGIESRKQIIQQIQKMQSTSGLCFAREHFLFSARKLVDARTLCLSCFSDGLQ